MYTDYQYLRPEAVFRRIVTSHTCLHDFLSHGRSESGIPSTSVSTSHSNPLPAYPTLHCVIQIQAFRTIDKPHDTHALSLCLYLNGVIIPMKPPPPQHISSFHTN